MSDLEPITRDEMLWSGEDLEPITRKEQYIKHLYDETQVIPEYPVTREEMFILKAGEELHDVTIEQLTATENKTYSEEGVAYSPVIVNVPQTAIESLSVVENGTYTAPSGKAYSPVTVNVPLPENAYLLKDIEGLPSAIATFSDGANLPMPKLEIGIEPVQDLHGYDAPWAGGAGSNKWDEVMEDGYVNPYTGDYENSPDNLRSKNRVVVNGLSEIYFCCAKSGTLGNFGYAFYDVNNTYISGNINSVNGKLEVPQNAYYFAFFVPKSWYGQSYGNNIAVNYPSTATTYEPYSNICPISGWTEEVMTRCGKNQAKKTIHGYINYQNSKMMIDNDSESVVFYAVAGKTYTVSSSVTMNRSMLGLADTDNITNQYQLLDIIELSNEVVTWTATWTGWTVWYKCTSAQSGFANSVQVEFGSTATTYEPYAGTTTTIPFTDSQGNPVEVFGGSVDVVNGGEQPNPLKKVVFDGSNNEGWNMFSSGAFYLDNALVQMDSLTIKSTPICLSNKYKEENAVANSSYVALTDDFSYFNQSGTFTTRLWIKDSNCSTLEAFKTALANAPLQVVYPLATPTTFYTQPTAVKSLDGENNVFADTGDVVEASYFESL